ncbi:MAG TPA: glycosyltransferase family 2 protein [Methylovirgula sp.]|nr:glycosyltransferase family 2 protein [Methylovirgula sp.]
MYNLDLVQEAELTRVPEEPVRDWSFGFITGHRTRIIVSILSLMVISSIWYFVSPAAKPPASVIDKLWSWSSLLWLSGLLPGSVGLVGALLYRHPTRLDDAEPISQPICWRIVTAGKNINVVLRTIRRCQNEMAKTPLAPYVIEVVMDYGDNILLLPQHDKDVRVIIVPEDYRTPNNSRFKARALHYALSHSTISDKTWIVHLDEETQPTSSGIKGICKFIREEERTQRLRIGQGALLYHREWKKYPFLTLADVGRTGDDFARFHLQHRLGVTLFGLHGSFIVVRNDVEKATGGFDFGPQGDITEDAFWAVKAMENGRRCAWIEGYLEEQSCMSLMDFFRQRRRWFQGLVKVALHAPVRLRWRFCLGVNTFLWGLAPFAMLYTFGNLLHNVGINPVIRFLASYSFAMFATLYVTGLKANMDEHGVKDWNRRTVTTVLLLVLLPVFAAMEGLGVLWAMLTPVNGFQVVKK